MVKSLLLLSSAFCMILLLSFTSIDASQSSPRIIGGVPATLGEFPFAVTVRLNGSHICGGLIYNERWILTSAFCVEDITELRLLEVNVADLNFLDDFEVDQASYSVGKIVLAPELDGKSGQDDLALLEVTMPMAFGDNVNCVNIAEPEPTGSPIGTLIGYGSTTNGGLASTRLRKGDVTMNGDCTTWGTNFREAYMICAGSASDVNKPCDYDSGSPLIQDGYAVGILSQQIGCQSFPFESSIYTRIASYFAWIRQEASTQPSSCFRAFTTPIITSTEAVNYDCDLPPPFTCRGKEDGYYPPFSDRCCQLYYFCLDEIEYNQMCGDPLVFDPNDLLCTLDCSVRL